jgi:hypothetical protein
VTAVDVPDPLVPLLEALLEPVVEPVVEAVEAVEVEDARCEGDLRWRVVA